VVTYSRPEKWKGFQDAVPAMGELMKLHPGKIEWHVYGFAHAIGPDNPLAPYKFHGALGHDELSRLYAESDIVLCPSWYESFPLPPIEAMACGTAVVTTPYGTEDYAIDGHTAIDGGEPDLGSGCGGARGVVVARSPESDADEWAARV
jgi:glycosyltransferase involved in cell wall biosynthesis